jgi:tellurite resistance protein TehA-like permease
MAQILLRLAAFNFLSLLAAFGFGVLSWARGGLKDTTVTSYELHLYVALFAVIFNLGLHCLIFIYFLGTGRWVKEVALAYRLPDEPLPKLTRELKRQTFPPALFAMLVPIAAAAAGMANIHQSVSFAAYLHAGFAILTLLINVWALRIEYRNVQTNAGVIDRVMAEVDRIRAEKGLPPSEQAWEQTA